MVRIRTDFILAILLAGVLIVSCGTPPQSPVAQGGIPVNSTPVGIVGLDEYQARVATSDAYSAIARATFEAETFRLTSTAAAATAVVAAASTSAAATTSAIGTATQSAIDMQGTSTAIDLQAQQTVSSMRITESAAALANIQQGTAQAQLANQNQQRIDAAATQEAIDNDIRDSMARREANWANFTQVLPYLATTLLFGVLGFTAFYFIYTQRNQVQVINENLLALRSRNGDAPIIYDITPTQPSRPQLPIPQPVLAAQVGPTVVQPTEPANWDRFCNWQDPLNLPVGITLNRRHPVLINRDMSPHVLIFGKSGIGKTTCGLIPYALAMIKAGVHTIIFNPQGSDFDTFRDMPGVTLLPRLTDDQAPGALTPLLDAAVAEIDRRDKILSQYGVSSWYELPPHAGQPGEFLIAIDEFLNMVATVRKSPLYKGTKLDDHFWLQLLRVTSRARKYGIFLGLTMTEPTQRLLGDDGMTVRGQMSRLGFHMDNAAASFSILDRPRNFPNGSTGLPMGQFVASVNGQTTQTIAFRPSKSQVKDFLLNHVPRPTPLPEQLTDVVATMALPRGAGWTPEADALNDFFVSGDRRPLLEDGQDDDYESNVMRYLNHEKATLVLQDAPSATSFRELEERHWKFEGGVARITVRGVLIAKFIELYHDGMQPEEIRRRLMPSLNRQAVQSVVTEALTKYDELAQVL